MSDKPTDTTSFASILAGVNKLRESSSKVEVRKTPAVEAPIPTNKNDSVASEKQSYQNVNKVTSNETSRGSTDNTKNTVSSFNKTSIYQTEYARNKTRPVESKIVVHPSQKGNPLIKSFKNIPYEYTSIIRADYLVNSHISVIFLSLKYHKIRPEYIYEKLKKFGVGNQSDASKGHLKILLLLLDTDTKYWDSLQELTKLCVLSNFTLVLLWSFEEAGDYIYLLKNADSTNMIKSGALSKFDIIKGTQRQDYYSRLLDTLTAVRSINKTDVKKVATSGKFRNFEQLVTDNGTTLELIEGFGSVKLERFKTTINEPFLYKHDYDNDPSILEWKEKCKKIRLERSGK